MSGHSKKYQLIETYGLLLVDITVIILSYVTAYAFRFADESRTIDTAKIVFLQMMILAILTCVMYNVLADGYSQFFMRGYFQELLYNIKFNLLIFLVISAWIYLFRLEDDFSRLMLGYFICFNAGINYVAKIVFKKYMLKYFKKSKVSDKLLVITQEKELQRVLAILRADNGWSYDIVGFVLTDDTCVGEEIDGYRIFTEKEDIIEMCTTVPMDMVLVDCPSESLSYVKELVQSFLTMGVVCHCCWDKIEIEGAITTKSRFAGFDVITYKINEFDYRIRLIKKVIDMFGAIMGVLITILIFPVVAAAIKIESPGPVVFKQTRIGKNGRRFTMYKFRSMYVGSEEKKGELAEQNEVSGFMFKIKDDPRVTKVGKFLRITSIDELPQFYNILKGDMSLVGTRPPTLDEFEKYNIYYRRRLSMTPGLTGLWQVSGRSNIKNFEDVVKLDLKYIDNWSLTEDFKIILLTIATVFKRIGSL